MNVYFILKNIKYKKLFNKKRNNFYLNKIYILIEFYILKKSLIKLKILE